MTIINVIRSFCHSSILGILCKLFRWPLHIPTNGNEWNWNPLNCVYQPTCRYLSMGLGMTICRTLCKGGKDANGWVTGIRLKWTFFYVLFISLQRTFHFSNCHFNDLCVMRTVHVVVAVVGVEMVSYHHRSGRREEWGSDGSALRI